MKNYFLLILVLNILSLGKVFAQVEAIPEITLQADGTSLLFINTLGVLADFDALKIDKSAFAGFRFGVNYFERGGVDGPTDGSPFISVDFLTRLTVFSKVVDVSLCPGFTYNKGNYSFLHPDRESGISTKLEGNVRVKLYKSYFGLIAKFGLSKEGYAGIGLFIGFSTRDK